MARQIFSYIIHDRGAADDTAQEMLAAAGKIDPDASVTALVLGSGVELDALCATVAASYREVWKVSHELLSYRDAEISRRLLARIVPRGSIVILPHDHFGLDLGPGLSIALDAAYLPDVVDVNGIEEGILEAVRQEFSGLVSTHVDCDISKGAVVTIRPGAFRAEEIPGASGTVSDRTDEAMTGGIPETGRRLLGIVKEEAAEVDITQAAVLVSVGRGIEAEENLDMVHELAAALGGEVSCSRPVVDAKWLGKERQVGNSGKTVKPAVYLALGISGAFQHVAGLKGNPFIVAVNKNSKAPIFQIADVGVVADILDLVPQLTERLRGTKE
jgi:electron transfer flavoprotein alpha subunit